MLVRVNQRGPGYYGEILRQIGDVFDMDPKIYAPVHPAMLPNGKKNPDAGKPIVDGSGDPRTCRWVTPLSSGESAPAVEAPPSRPFGAGPLPGSLKDAAAPKSPKAKASEANAEKTL